MPIEYDALREIEEKAFHAPQNQIRGLSQNSVQSIEEKIQLKLHYVTKQAVECEELLGLLKKNPDIQRILELLNQYI